MNPEFVGVLGAVVGGVVGVAGGAVGTYFSLRTASGPRERRFAVGVSAAAWLTVTAFLAAMYVTPAEYRPWLWVPYAALLPVAAVACNHRQAAIRAAEAAPGG